jgi:hypothetical protein
MNDPGITVAKPLSPGPEKVPLGAVFAMVVGIATFVLLMGGELWAPDRTLVYRDIPRLALPNLACLQAALREGGLPWLDPAKGAGMPFLFDPQTCAQYPLAWLAAWLGPETGFRVFQAGHLLALGAGFGALALCLGAGTWGAVLTGVTAAGALPHLLALEWMPLIAGLAWVPWLFLGALKAWRGLLVLSLLGLVFSGHAYLWVMVPFLALASLVLSPPTNRAFVGLAVLLLPFLTISVWGGYLTLSGQGVPHGFVAGQAVPVIGFAPKHLVGFLAPKAFLGYVIPYQDGTKARIERLERFGWTRGCYLGVLPWVLLLLGRLRPLSPARQAGLVLAGSGLALSMGLPFLADLMPGVMRQMYHPASFIGLTVFGILLCLADAPIIRALGKTAMMPVAKRRGWGIGLGTTLWALGHWWLAGRATARLAAPIWYYTWEISWPAYLIIGVCATILTVSASIFREASIKLVAEDAAGASENILLPRHAFVPGATSDPVHTMVSDQTLGLADPSARADPPTPDINRAPGRAGVAAWGLALLLCGVQVGDLYWHGREQIPLTMATATMPDSLYKTIRHDTSRVLVMNEVIGAVKSIGGTLPREFIREFFACVYAAGLPNIQALHGLWSFGDYNPPLMFPRREHWKNRIDEAPDDEKNLLLALGGIRYLVTRDDFIPQEHWKLLAEMPFGDVFGVRLWQNDAAFPAAVMTLAALRQLEKGLPPTRFAGVAAEDARWEAGGYTLRIPAAPASGAVLFVPVNPPAGWRASSNDRAVPLIEYEGFGVAVPLHEGAARVRLEYREPRFPVFVVVALLAGLLLFWGHRRLQR